MKKLIASVVALAATCLVAEATEWTFNVAAGDTKTVDEVVTASQSTGSPITLTKGDTIKKTGAGTLKSSAAVKAVALNYNITEGVYYAANSFTHPTASPSTMKIAAGATLNIQGNTTDVFSGKWSVYFAGTGVGTGDNMGAICVGAANVNNILGSDYGTLTMTGDATIYSYGQYNCLTCNETLDMQNHTLTIRGKSGVEGRFRPRHSFTINNPGPIIVVDGILDRHASTTTVNGRIPSVTFTEGGDMASLPMSVWGNVDVFSFEQGCEVVKAYSGNDNNDIEMGTLIGPAAIGSVATVTVTNRLVARAADLTAGYALAADNALTLADGAALDIQNWPSLDLTAGKVYTIATSKAQTDGTPLVKGTTAKAFTAENTGSAFTMTVKDGIVSATTGWGLQPGEENAAANSAALATGLAGLAAGAVVAFPAGDYYFDGGMDLSSLTAQNVTFVGTDGTHFRSPVTQPETEGFAIEGVNYLTAGDFVITVGAGERQNWVQALAVSGFAAADVSGKRLVKMGAGTFEPKVSLADAGISGLVVAEGVYLYTTDLQLGVAKTKVTVKKGATLYSNCASAGSGKGLNHRDLTLEGAGAPGQLGAFVFDGSSSYNNYTLCNLTMTGDATMYTRLYGTGSDRGAFHRWQSIAYNGHTLTLTGPSTNYSFRIARCFNPKSPGGTLVVSNVTLTCSAEGDGNEYVGNVSAPVHTILTANARLVPDDDKPFKVFNDIEADAGTEIVLSNAKDVALDNLTGAPTFGSKVSSLTIRKKLGVRFAEAVAGTYPTLAKPLTFGSDCSVELLADFETILAQSGKTFSVIQASSVTGTPSLTGEGAGIATVANDGTKLNVTVKSGFVNAQTDGGLKTGEENAAANSAALSTLVSKVDDSTTVYFPAGDYYFDGGCDLASVTKDGVTLWNPDTNAVLHASLLIGAAKNVVVDGLAFSGLEGPAIIATGTEGLAIANCRLDGVAGAYEGGHYPFAAVNVTDFDLRDFARTFTTFDWDAQAYFDGGTQVATSRAYANAIVVDVSTADYWKGWDVTNKMGLAASAYYDKKLRKVGLGTLDPNWNCSLTNVLGQGVKGVEIVQGCYVTRQNNNLGVRSEPVRVWSGANLTIAGSGAAINARTVYISGTGTASTYPAVRFTETSAWNKANEVRWILEDDATMYDAVNNAADGTFLNSKIDTRGHTLTLTGGNYRFGRSCSWYGGGTVVVSGSYVSSSPVDDSAKTPTTTSFEPKDGNYPVWKFRSGATFAPDNMEFCYLASVLDFETTNCTWTAKDGAALPHDFKVRAIAGVPKVNDKILSISISSNLTAHAADLFAAAPAVFKMAGDLKFEAGATFSIDDLSNLADATPDSAKITIAEVTGEGKKVLGKPKADAALRAKGWTVLRDGAQRLVLGPKPGAVILLR